MRTGAELETSVPAFLGKLWRLVEDPETDDLICWAPNGRSFFIRNQAQFARELLPHYYKHNNMASFVRQLNMYGFHKKLSVELGGLKCERDEMEFAHQYFIKGHGYLLENIKRKIAATKSQEASHQPMKPEIMSKVLAEVRSMRGRQEHLDTRLGAMKRENEALWRELALLRQKHFKQQEIVNKLIHFLVTLVQPSRAGGLPVKRRYPLMIDSNNDIRCKRNKISKPEQSPTGPVIHELDCSEHDLDSQFGVGDIFDNSTIPAVHSPEEEDVESAAMDEENLETVEMMENAIRISEEAMATLPKEEPIKNKPPRRKKEETLMLETSSPDEDPTIVPSVARDAIAGGEEKWRSKEKPLAMPARSVRSSKLAAMAANINKMKQDEEEEEEDSSEENYEPTENEGELAKLEEIFVLPDLLADEETPSEGRKKNGNGRESWKNTNSNDKTVENDEKTTAGTDEKLGQLDSNSKDLSLRCVSPNGTPGTSYKLGAMKDMDTHLETMQTELENLREVLLGEGYSIDANTLLGLFGADDPMSFGIPVNPELAPQREKEHEETDPLSTTSAAGGELMTYTPSTSLLDFDDDIFLGQMENTGSYELSEDNKASLLASLKNSEDPKP